MEAMDYWRLCDEFSVVQAALLILGYLPQENEHIMNWRDDQRPENFPAVFSALVHAALAGRLEATLRYKADVEGYGQIREECDNLLINGFKPADCEMIYYDNPNWDMSTIKIEDLKKWLSSRGFTTGFFFPEAGEDDCPYYLDKSHKNYAPKLAAAVGAWQAVNADPELIKGKTVKQALLKWLRKNADQFGLTKDDGNPNEQGIEEISKISNWDTKGGAPKTQG